MKRPNLHIDGTTQEGIFAGLERGYSDRPPFAVFDANAQDWIGRDLQWLWVARLSRAWHWLKQWRASA